MSLLPQVTERTREKISREFDDLGPDACMADITDELRRHNPELLDMAVRWAATGDETVSHMRAFGIFYRVLALEAAAPQGPGALSPLPRISPAIRQAIVEEIDRAGDEAFTREAINNLEELNPELLQMAHFYAAQRADYGRIMQGFALFHQALLIQYRSDRATGH